MNNQYPIGKFSYQGEVNLEQRERWIEEIDQLPSKLFEAVRGLSIEQLDTPYRRTFYHPESKQKVQLDYNLGIYAWHGNHHTAHITSLRRQLGW